MMKHLLAFLLIAPSYAQTPGQLEARGVSVANATYQGKSAVRLDALPDAANDGFSKALRPLQSFVRPYVLLTSQWQQWNLFSPDPLRRIVTYRMEKEEIKGWSTVETFDAGTYSVFRQASEFKFLGRLLEGGQTQLPLVANFLQQECTAKMLPLGTHVRLVYLSSVIALPQHPFSLSGWQNLNSPERAFIGSETLCGWPLSSSLLRAFP